MSQIRVAALTSPRRVGIGADQRRARVTRRWRLRGSGGAPPSQSGSGSTAAPSVALPEPQDYYSFDTTEGVHYDVPIWDAAQQEPTAVETQWVKSELDKAYPDANKQYGAAVEAQAYQWYSSIKAAYRAANRQGGTKSKRQRLTPPPWG